MIWKHIDFANIKHEDWFDSLCVQYKDTKQKWTYVSHVSIIKKVLTSPHRKHAETNRFFRSSTDFIKHKKTIYNNRTAQFSTAQRLGLFQWCRISQKNPQTWNHTRSQQHLTTLLGVCLSSVSSSHWKGKVKSWSQVTPGNQCPHCSLPLLVALVQWWSAAVRLLNADVIQSTPVFKNSQTED